MQFLNPFSLKVNGYRPRPDLSAFKRDSFNKPAVAIEALAKWGYLTNRDALIKATNLSIKKETG